MEKRFDTVLDNQGRPVRNALVYVTEYPGGDDAVIYPADGGDPYTSNVLTTDQYGFFEYYAADGRYSWRIVTNTDERTINDILHGNAALEISGEGYVVTDGDGNLFTRDITVAGDGIAIEAGDGQAGNTVLSIADDLAVIEALTGTGTLTRTGDETWELVTPEEAANPITVIALQDANQVLSITAGTDKDVLEAFPGCEIVAIWAGLKEASSDGNVVLDVHVDGVSIMTDDKLTIEEGETTTFTATDQPVLTTTVIDHGSRVTLDYDSAGDEAIGPIVYLAVRFDQDVY